MRDQLAANAADRHQQLQNLFRLAAGGERQHHVAAHQHAQIAMDGLSRMKIQRRRPGRAERGRNLARDDPALAHAGYHHAAAAGIQAFHGALKILRHGTINAVGQFAQRFRFNAYYVGTSGFHSEIIVAEKQIAVSN